MSAQWFEDIVLCVKREIGSYTFGEDEIVAFARKYDPQPFHIDREAATASIYGGIIASGLHTGAIWMKLMIASRDAAPKDGNGDGGGPRSGVSPGFEDMRWLKPVRPGLTLYYSTEPIEKIDLKSRPELGLLKSRNEARDANGELYMSFVGKGFVPKKPKDS